MSIKGVIVSVSSILIGLSFLADIISFGIIPGLGIIKTGFYITAVFFFAGLIMVYFGWHYLQIKMDKFDRKLKKKWEQ